jgi:hypothetical protein
LRSGFFAVQRTISLTAGETAEVAATMRPPIILEGRPPPTPPPPPPPPPTVTLGPGPTPTRPPDSADPGDPPPIREAHWNSWIQRDQDGPAVSRIQVGNNYTFDFDLAAFNYRAIADFPATVSVPAAEEFRRALDEFRGNTARFHVKPVLGGRGLAFLPGESEVRRVDADLTRLRTPPSGWSRDEPLHLLSPRLRAAQVRIEVKAQSEGCAAIGLSIWNATLDRPIDYLVREIRVGGDATSPPCGPADPAKALRGSLISLLAIQPDQLADAAIHVFEMPSSAPRSYVVFKVRDGPLLSWRLERLLSEYVTAGLVDRLRVARSSTNNDYGIVGRALSAVLFPPDNSDATNALGHLSQLVNRSDKPVVFARLVDVTGTNMFLPLGLLRLTSGGLLGEVVTVTQPLPKSETYTAGSHCVGAWTMVLPDDLGTGVDTSYLTPVRDPIPNRILRLSDFKSYARAQPTDASKGEGFLLLAHHADGELWFVHGPDSILSEEISRRYPRGSVAVLSACALGDPAAHREAPLLAKLNELGIEAAIVSPFEIQGPVGARFAFHFANEVMKARGRGEGADLTSLFRRAVAAVRGDASVAQQKNAVYEFVLAGNGGLRLCP